MVIGGTATALKSYFYSDSPCNDAIKEGVKALIPAPKGFDPIKDELVDIGLDWYIDEYNLPKM